jgi:class 3 adenylate cyclase
LVNPKIAEHRGRIVKNTGDGMLAEFSSVVDAVRCAAEVRGAMADRNAETPEDKRITFRVGINLGDVAAARLSQAVWAGLDPTRYREFGRAVEPCRASPICGTSGRMRPSWAS